MFDPGGCTGHLRSCRFWEGGTRRLLDGRLDAAMVIAKAEALLIHGGVEHHLQERTSNPYVLRSIAVFPQPG